MVVLMVALVTVLIGGAWFVIAGPSIARPEPFAATRKFCETSMAMRLDQLDFVRPTASNLLSLQAASPGTRATYTDAIDALADRFDNADIAPQFAALGRSVQFFADTSRAIGHAVRTNELSNSIDRDRWWSDYSMGFVHVLTNCAPVLAPD